MGAVAHVSFSDSAGKKGKKSKKDKKAEMDELKQELEMDEHRVPIDELYARLGTNPETVRSSSCCIHVLMCSLSSRPP